MNRNNLKRSIVINGHKTSVSLENEFWRCLREMATLQNTTLAKLVEQIDQGRNGGNLSSAIRVFLFTRAQNGSAEAPLNNPSRLPARAQFHASRANNADQQ
jgi:predicted DNA-binding ribbon-helix-helix protein